MSVAAGFLPAAGRAPLALYDGAVALGMREGEFRGRLLAQVLGEGRRPDVLDVGAGTGTFAIALAQRGARVVAIDPDPAALARARAKDGAAAVTWLAAGATASGLEAESVDRVVLSLVLHHLSDDGKAAALAEALRVLRPGGTVHVADWTRPGDPLMCLAFSLLRLIDGCETPASLGRGELPGMLARAGFVAVREHDRLRTAFGRLALTVAAKP